MSMTASTGQARIETPAVRLRDVAPRKESSCPPQSTKGEDLAERETPARNGTAGEANENSLGWAIDTSGSGQETKTTREILDTIDADTLQAAQIKGRARPQIEANRDRVAALLGLRDEWKRPDEIYADEAWEICIIWRSGYGRVEIGTEEDGSIAYFVRRTLSEESREGIFRGHTTAEISKIMSWLNEVPEEI